MFILKQSIQDTLQVAGEETISNNALPIVIIILSVFILIFFLIRDSRSKGKKQPEENKLSEQPDSQKESNLGLEEVPNYLVPQEEVPNIEPEKDKEDDVLEESEDKSPKSENISKPIDNLALDKTNNESKIKVNPEILFIIPEDEKRSKMKFIGYEPNHLFHQEEPYNYPIVIMPGERSVIKFPRKNKIGNKGYTEEHFYSYISKYFSDHFMVYNDRIMIVTTRQNAYEPDIAIINETNGINLFVDIEIDEPYDGITREPIHYSGYDNERNRYFSRRGWLTIRFAEVQVWKYPESCCKYLFKVISSIISEIEVPNELLNINDLEFILQWTKEQAREGEELDERESYLGIDGFDPQSIQKEFGRILFNELEDKIEDQVNEDDEKYETNKSGFKTAVIQQALNTGKYISCKYSDDEVYTIIKPISLNEIELKAYCYVENVNRTFAITDLNDIIIRDRPFQVRINDQVGVDEIKRVVQVAIDNNKIVRMKYTRSEWTSEHVNEETGEIILNHTESEQSQRTISNIDYSVNVLDQEQIDHYNLDDENYITAHCHKRKEQRTFRFDRINELEILNI